MLKENNLLSIQDTAQRTLGTRHVLSSYTHHHRSEFQSLLHLHNKDRPIITRRVMRLSFHLVSNLQCFDLRGFFSDKPYTASPLGPCFCSRLQLMLASS